MKMTPEEIAYHEAGHCFCAWYLGIRLEEITVAGPYTEIKDEDGKHLTPYYCSLDCQESGLDQSVENFTELAISWMGSAAVEMQRNGSVSFAGLRDIRDVMRRLYPKDSSLVAMAQDARDLLENTADWETATELFFEKHGRLAMDIIDSDRSKNAIRVLADRLTQDGRLSGYDAALILERVYGLPLPEKALPLRRHKLNIYPDSSLESVLEFASRIARLIFDDMRSYRPKNEEEEIVIDKAAEKALEAVFYFGGLVVPAAS